MHMKKAQNSEDEKFQQLLTICTTAMFFSHLITQIQCLKVLALQEFIFNCFGLHILVYFTFFNLL